MYYMAKKENNKKIYRPRNGADLPETPHFNPETGEPVAVDKRKAFNEWLKRSKVEQKDSEECYSGLIDPKQAFYARKKRKDND